MALFDESLADLNNMLAVDPSVRSEVEREQALVRRKAKEADAKQRKEFGNFFQRTG